MTEKQEERAVSAYANQFEENIRKTVTGVSVADNPNITFREFSLQYLERIKREFSLAYYAHCRSSIGEVNKLIGGYKVRELTPAIIQNCFDKPDKLEKKVTKVYPVPNFKEILASYGYNYTKLRHGKNIQPGSLAKAFKGNPVGRKWAEALCLKTNIPYNELFSDEQASEPYSYGTINIIKKTVRAIMAVAKKNRLAEDNYASSEYVNYPTKPPHAIHCMDDEDARKFFSTVMEHKDIRIKTSMLIFILMGFRRGEVAGLQVSDIDFDNGTITVRRSTTNVAEFGLVIKEPKTEKGKRTISAPKLLMDCLREYITWRTVRIESLGDRIAYDEGWLFFKDNGGCFHPCLYREWLNKVLKIANIEHCSVHSLRHTNITMQIAAGVPIVTVSARAGHAHTSTTSDYYAHFLRSSDVSAANTIENIFAKP
ncbi:MAG: site-specific integrase [Christensenellales bacterium]